MLRAFARKTVNELLLDLSLDKLIYEIAGLSGAEILIIENSTSGKH